MVIPVVDDVRRNHALEHATITIMLQKLGRPVRLAGRSTPRGFYVYGNLDTALLTECAHEALQRLRAGEADLAVSPMCGTNLAVAGVLAGLSSFAVLGSKPKAEKLPRVIMFATGSVLASQPIGRLAQKYVTTAVGHETCEITRISANQYGPLTVHRVDTQYM